MNSLYHRSAIKPAVASVLVVVIADRTHGLEE